MSITTIERELLARVADLLIPQGDKMPSATQALVHTEGIDKVFTVRPDLEDGIRIALDALAEADTAGRFPDSFDALYGAEIAGFAQLSEAVTAAYFLNPHVATSVGYTKRSEIPIVFDTDLDFLVRDVTARGPIYRPTPGESRRYAKAVTS